MSFLNHPYYPRDLYLENYVPPTWDALTLVLTFGLSQLWLLGPTAYYLLYQRQWSRSRTAEFTWFLSCTFIHLLFEGYFVYYHKEIAGKTDLFGELWKEYAKCDSRYLTQDPTVLFIEALTAVVIGPLCLVTCLLMLHDSLLYHLPALLVSFGQLYGSLVYVATTLHINSPHSIPHPYYHYFYFGFFNSFWFILPIIQIFRSSLVISNCVSPHKAPLPPPTGDSGKSKRH